MITVHFSTLGYQKEFPFGVTLEEIALIENIKLEYPIIGALVNNKVQDLKYRVHKPVVISYFDITSQCGIEAYNRSVYFVLSKAVHDLLPGTSLKILHSISGGKYCELENLSKPLTSELVEQIEFRMREITQANIPFIRKELLTQEALEVFRKHNMKEKARLFQGKNTIFTSVYYLSDYVNYYYNILAPSTGVANVYKLELYENGILLKLPSRKRPLAVGNTQKLTKFFSVHKTYKKWVTDLGVAYINDINKKIPTEEIESFLQISEAFHEKLLANIADEIYRRRNVKVVLLSGPSSSGKTTTCRRLSVQLSILGYRPVQVSVDDFFVEREETPRDENGEYNFETVHAIDLPLFNDTLNRLLKGEEVEIPTFNFTTGKKEWHGKKIKLEKRSILVIEGIHCLNPILTEQVDDKVKFKLFVSALIPVSIDAENPIPTTDCRLLRRMVRDHAYRNYSALETIRRWASVREGELKYIFPFQEQADVMFNTSLICELGVLKKFAIPLLREVPETEPEYAEAHRLLKFLSFCKSIPEKSIPPGSILREFVGGSQFKY